jgi:hypothetical protein
MKISNEEFLEMVRNAREHYSYVNYPINYQLVIDKEFKYKFGRFSYEYFDEERVLRFNYEEEENE